MMIIILVITIMLVIMINQFLGLDDKYRITFSLENNMAKKFSGIIYPSIGHPLRVEIGDKKRQKIDIYVILPEQPKGEINGKLLSVLNNTNVKEINLSFNKMENNSEYSRMNSGLMFSDWILSHSSSLYRIEMDLNAIQIRNESRNTLFDLELKIGNNTYVKKNCLYITNGNHGDTMDVLLATDIHVASRWDKLEEEIQTIFPKRKVMNYDSFDAISRIRYEDLFLSDTFIKSYSNPNKNFIKFIKKANKLHDEGKLDFIILSGDLVDYKYSSARDQANFTFGATEWYLFEKILLGEYPNSERLHVPIFTSTGNHDYRLFPYKLQIYGIKHCGIPDDYLEEYLRKTNQFLDFKYRLSDVDAIRINTGENHSLDFYYLFFNPFNDYCLDFSNLKLLFLDTNSDVVCHLEHFFSSRLPRLISDIEHPSSQGFIKEQIKYIKNIIGNQRDSSKNLILIAHAPLINTYKYFTGKEDSSECPLPSNNLDLNKSDDESFSAQLANLGLSTSSIFQNQFDIFKILVNNEKSSIVFSGHNHRVDEYGFAKKSNELMRYHYSKNSIPDTYLKDKVLFFQTPSLGHVQRSEQEMAEPSYRKLKIVDGLLKNAEVIQLKNKPFDQVSSHIIFKNKDNSASIDLYTSVNDTLSQQNIVYRFLIIFDPLDQHSKDFEITVDKNNLKDILHSDQYLENNLSFYVYYFKTNSIKWNILNKPESGKFKFALEPFINKNEKYMSLGLKRFHQEME